MNRKANPDFIVFESSLKKTADALISQIPEKILRKQKFGDRHVLCLVKKEKLVGLKDSKNKFSDKPFHAKKIITIIPEKYRSNEMKADQIIEETKYKDCLERINYEFF